ncbi:aminoglycoside phosphotransferase family protein [Candidatus Dependentiae bacterium]|nr:aminoglycoside phosphotransferase family protein [Candidatus Dependentiae bacterium]
MPSTNRIIIDVSLVRQLITGQFPQWATLPIEPVKQGGWDNRTFHLGKDMTVRLPSAAEYSPQVEKEHRWLPQLAPFLPLFIPEPLALGNPTKEYPWHWSIYRWIEGETASIERITNLCNFASMLADFLRALQHIDAVGGPIAGTHNFYRGGSLATYDSEVRQAVKALQGKIDTDAVVAIWNRALSSTWKRSPVWVHGDVSANNLLVHKGQLNALIDFGCLAVGDPACDLSIAWTLFKGESRKAFRGALSLDKETWERGQGWTLWKALITCAAESSSDCLKKNTSYGIISQLVAEYKQGD